MSNEIRILAVEDAANRGGLAKLLSGGTVSVVAEAGYGPEAVTAAQSIAPDAIVVSLEEPIARPLRTIEILTAAQPGAPIVVVSSVQDRDALRKSIRAGARDYLTRPVSREEAQKAVAAAHEAQQKQAVLSAPERRETLATGELIALFGAKGGIGKSTLAVNLTLALAKETAQRVVVVDLDLQLGDVALMLNFLPRESIADAIAAGDRLGPDLIQSLVYEDKSGVRVMPAPRKPEETGHTTPEEIDRVLEGLVRSFDYVVADTSPSLSDVNLAVLERATLIMLMTTPQLPSLKRTKIALELILGEWKFPPERVKLVVNYSHPQNGIVTADVDAALGHPIYWTVPYDREVSHGITSGRPLVEINPKSPYSRSVVELAQKISGTPGEKKGVFSRLLRR
jgi:pilus assembly protein CpaE